MTRKSRPRRACAMCKYFKYIGNSAGRLRHRDRKSEESYKQQLKDTHV